jgi:hypothetical protein
VQNLRDGISLYRTRFMKESRERQRNTLLSVCLVRTLACVCVWVGGRGGGSLP